METEQRNGHIGVLLIPALAIAYYFGIALPEHQKAQLAFEKQKYEDIKKEKQDKAKADEEAETAHLAKVLRCQANADQAYWDYVKLNGTAVVGKAGTYTASKYIWEEAQKRKDNSHKECMAL